MLAIMAGIQQNAIRIANEDDSDLGKVFLPGN